jgi:hypothetical protein
MSAGAVSVEAVMSVTVSVASVSVVSAGLEPQEVRATAKVAATKKDTIFFILCWLLIGLLFELHLIPCGGEGNPLLG